MDHEETSLLREEPDTEMQVVSEGTDILLKTPHFSCSSVCVFAKQNTNILESEQRLKSARKLCGIIVLTLIFMIVEIVGGLKSNSLAVLTDAAHLLTDVASFAMSLFALWASSWKATSHQSFGFNRLEVLGALLSVQLIWIISGLLVYEAVDRLFHERKNVNGKLMFEISALGFFMNVIMITLLGHDHAHHGHDHAHHGHDHAHHGHDHPHHGHDDAHHGHDHAHHGHHQDHSHGHNHDHSHDHEHEKGELCVITDKEEVTSLVSNSREKTKILDINIQGAYLHIMADLIQSIGVMIAGAVVWAKPEWLVVDLICTLMFSVLVLSSTISILRNIYGILMERTPHEIDNSRLENGLKCIKGVQDVHDLHVWSITVGKVVLSCHVVTEPGASSSEILYKVRDYCEKEYRISHVTVQIE